jgi:hypothetical protein
MSNATLLKRVSQIQDGDYFSSLSEENWLAEPVKNMNPALLARMLEVAYLAGKHAAYVEYGQHVTARASRTKIRLECLIAVS